MVADGGGQQTGAKPVEVVQDPKCVDAAVSGGRKRSFCLERPQGVEPHAFAQPTIRRHPDPAVRMIEHLDESCRGVGSQVEARQHLSLTVLDPVDPRELVVPIRTGRRVVRAVRGTASIVVHRDLIVEIDQIQCPIRSDAAVDWLEPVVRAGEKMRLPPPRFAPALVGHAGRVEELMVHQPDRGLVQKE